MAGTVTPPSPFSHESLEERDTVAQYLRAISDGLASGRLSLSSGEGELILEPEGLVRFRVSAKRSAYRSRINIKISWRANRPQDGQEAAALVVKSASSRSG
jgi:amphi-Trp domain-containing protein